MDMFVRGKSKPKRRPELSTPIISTPIPQQSSNHGPHSPTNQVPSSPPYSHTHSGYTLLLLPVPMTIFQDVAKGLLFEVLNPRPLIPYQALTVTRWQPIQKS
ncbi:unnamed protein product [Absidia cylindrospora]